MQIGAIEGILKLRDEFSGVLNRAADNVDRVGSRLGKALDRPVKHSQLQVAALAAGLVLLGKKVLDATAEAQAAMAQLEAGVASTGGAAGRSAAQLEVMAGKLQRLTGIDDEVIQGGQALLLVYRRIGKDAFEPTLQAALNLSARGFGPLETTAKMVGKAMNDPIKGVTTLERQLGKFDPAVKATIRSLMEHGRIAEAQGIILEEVDKKVGGAAEAFRNTLPGAISALKGAWENLFEKVGETAGSGGAFQTAINSMVRGLEYLEDNWHEIEAAIFLTLGNISSRLVKFAADTLGVFETIARGAQRFQNLIPNFFGFGLAGKSQKVADAAVKKSGALRKELLQLADDLETGFAEKANNAIAAGLAPVKGLDKGMQDLDDTVGGLSDKARKLAEDLGDLRAELILDIQQTREMTAAVISGDPAAIANLEKTHALHRAYLQDVDKFGRKAADGLAVLRRSGADAKQELDLFKELDQKWNDFVEEVTKKSRTINEDAAREMEDSVRAIFNASFVDWTDFNDKVKAAVQARADERIALESEVWSFTATGFEMAIADARAWHADFVRRIESAVDRGVISIVNAEEQLAAARVKLIEQEARIRAQTLIGEFGSIFDYLADQFGGLFNYISRLINQVQQAQQFGSSVTNVASAAGMSSSAAGSLGTAASLLVIWKAIYDIGMDIIKTNKSKKFGQAGTFWITGGEGRTGQSPGVGQVSTDAIKAIQNVVKAFEDSLRLSIDDLSEIGIKLRNDGKKIKAYVAGVFIGEFNDVMEAIQAAVAKSITSGTAVFSDMSDLMKQGLGKLKGTADLDNILDFLGQLREIGDLGLTAAAIDLKEQTRHFDDLWKTLKKVGGATPAVVQGFNNLVMAEGRLWQNWIDSITGREKSNAEILADKVRELAIFKVEKDVRRAVVAQRILEIQSIIAALKAGRALIGGTPGGGGSGGGGGGGILGVAKAFSTAGSVITQTAIAVTSASVTLASGAVAMIAALEAEAAALIELQKLLDSIHVPDAKDIKIPSAGGAGGRDQLRDFIEQRGFELDLSGLSEYARRIAEIGREYALQLEQAGRDIKLRQQLIDLKERELALLAKEQKESLAGRFREFLGLVTPFDQIRETVAQLIKDIEESPFGDERKARMIGRVLDDLERQIEQLAQESALSLFSQLSQDLEKFGADEAMMSEVRRNMAIIEHTLKLAHYRTEIAILKAQGVLSDSVLNTLQGALNFLDRIDPTKLLKILEGPRFKGYDDAPINETVNKIKDAIDSATRTLEDMEREALNPLVRDLLELQDKFKPIYEALGHVARVEDAYASQLKLIMQRHFGAINDLLDSLETSDLSPLRTIDQFGISLSKFRNTISAISTGDFAKLEEVPDLVQTLLALTKQVRPLGSQGYRDVFEEIQSSLRQLASIANLPAGVLTQLSSGIGLGNLLLPNQFAAVNQPLAAADVSTPIVNVIGKHSDRQILVLNSMDARLGAIQSSTEVLVSISESTNSVLSQVR